MTTAVSIRVRNPEFYEAFEEFKKSQGNIKMSHNDWVAYNDNKIPMYSTYVGFEFGFVVNSNDEKKSKEYDLEVFSLTNYGKSTPNKHIFHLDNVRVIEFIGDNKSSFVVVSNELFHQKINIEKDKNDHEYLYFYLKENADNNRLTDNIWLSDEKIEVMRNLFGDFAIQKDLNLIKSDEGVLIR